MMCVEIKKSLFIEDALSFSNKFRYTLNNIQQFNYYMSAIKKKKIENYF